MVLKFPWDAPSSGLDTTSALGGPSSKCLVTLYVDGNQTPKRLLSP